MTRTVLNMKQLKEESRKARNVIGYQEMVRFEKELGEGMGRCTKDSKPIVKNSVLAQNVCMLGRQVGHRISRTPKDMAQCLLKRKDISRDFRIEEHTK